MIGIYKITNTLNNKVYVGQSIDIETRWEQHIYASTHNLFKYNTKLYQAIRKFNIENFLFEVIEELKKEELNERERYWINYYNSYNNGYNSTFGGQGESSWFFNPNLIQQLWDDGYSMPEIAHFINCSVTTVGRRLKNYKNYTPELSYKRSVERRIYRNFSLSSRRSYTVQELNKIYQQSINIYQYDLNGNFLKEYSSIIEAGRLFNSNKKNGYYTIHNALKNKQPYAYGYLWSINKVEKLPKYNYRNNNAKYIQCIETNQIFSSLKEAAQWCNLKYSNTISNYLSGKRKSAGKHPLTGEKLHWKIII